MKVAVIGAGSLGCALAGIFSQGGAEVTVYDRNEAILETIRRQGVTVKMKDKTIQSTRIAADVLPGDLRAYDLVCVAVKSTQTENLMGELMGSAGQDTVFFTMQSGLENTDLLAAYVPRNHILCGMGFWSMEQKADGEVKLCTLPEHPVELAMLEAGRDAKGVLKDVRKVFEKAGVAAEIRKEPEPVLWKNAIFQSSIQPVVTALRLLERGMQHLPCGGSGRPLAGVSETASGTAGTHERMQLCHGRGSSDPSPAHGNRRSE